jgi:hypothetical protein
MAQLYAYAYTMSPKNARINPIEDIRRAPADVKEALILFAGFRIQWSFLTPAATEKERMALRIEAAIVAAPKYADCE